MRVIKQREIVDDSWQLAPAGAPISSDGDLIIGLTEWNAAPDTHAARAGKTGKVAGEHASFEKDGAIPAAHDLSGPAGDPAEGKR